MRRVLFIPVFLLVAAACGNGDGTATDASPSPTPASEEAQQLTELASGWSGRDVRITYAWHVETEDQTQDGTLEIFQQVSQDRWRMDFEQGDQSASVLQGADASYFCSHPEESCFAVPAAQAPNPAPFLAQTLQDPGSLDDLILGQSAEAGLETSSETLAGIEVTCFSATSAQGTGEWCLSGDGVLLAYRVEVTQGTQTFEATDVSEDLSDADFDVPYEVQELPQQPGQPQPGQPQPQPQQGPAQP